jgi:hypothetical protein
MQVAIDMDAGKMWFGTNNTWLSSADPAAGTNEAFSGLPSNLIPGISLNGAGTPCKLNFGQLGFAHTPPAGFKALNSQNMPAPEILEGNSGMDTVLYTGTGAEKSITDLEFSPDFTWIKSRDEGTGAYNGHHLLFDTLRGATEILFSNLTNAENTDAQSLKSFDSNGFTVGTTQKVNESGDAFVAWNWKADPKFGFDIVGYEGTGVAHTIPHDLGIAPEMMIVKRRDAGGPGWPLWHKDMIATPENYYMRLDTVIQPTLLTNMWNGTAPTSSVFTVGVDGWVNTDEGLFIAYLFASIPGFSKVFSYTGNGNADGPFIYCGFRPRYILIKNASGVGNWVVNDSVRGPYNVNISTLYPNLVNAEPGTGWAFDLLSSGFKVRESGATINGSGNTLIGIAFAEHPFQFANAR